MDDLTPQERAVLEAVSANPFAGQQEIAAGVGLARSTVAAHVTQLVQKGYILGRAYVLPEPRRVVCVGGATLDRKYYPRGPLISGTSNPVEGRQSFGGVARNVAESLVRLGVRTSLASVIGDDENGRSLVRHLRDLGVDTSQVVTTTQRRTAEYCAILSRESELILGIADMGVLDLFTEANLERIWPHLASATWVFADCNLPAEVLARLCAMRPGARFRLAVDTVSAPKARRLPADLSGIDLLVLNTDEAEAYLTERGDEADRTPAETARALRAAGADTVVLTRGLRGLLVATEEGVTGLPAVKAQSVDVTGAGDGLIAGMLSRLIEGLPIVEAATVGSLLAALTTESESSVDPRLSNSFLESQMHRLPAAETVVSL